MASPAVETLLADLSDCPSCSSSLDVRVTIVERPGLVASATEVDLVEVDVSCQACGWRTRFGS